ncbi:hypothetical protein MRB53_003375 [Persea americana]|uniref:Uncharacterized protein n=1 Tax=Persea americana TaxID=3435 RepID=A0ACC2MX16_PERAE|nr:hypothetical protein MRB53_003375 [Persea americana]
MSSSSAPKKRGLGRGPNQIPKAPVNPDERILIQMRPHPDSTTAVVNRASGAPEGNKAPGTYKGGSTSQLQHVAAREASSQGQPIHWLDVYVATRDGLPEAVQIVETYNTLMDKRYPEGTSQPPIDQELWERASVVKKNYV